MDNGTKENLKVWGILLGIIGGIYFIATFYPEVGLAMGKVWEFIALVVLVAFVVGTQFFYTDDQKDEKLSPKKKAIKMSLFVLAVLVILWWLSKPIEVIYESGYQPGVYGPE